MRSVNYFLRKVYKQMLSGITYGGAPVPVFYQHCPDNINPDNYIIFGSISSTDTSTKHNADTETTITVKIHTYRASYNSGEAADTITDEILQALYPTPQAAQNMTADGFQMVDTKLVSDVTQPYSIMNSVEYIDRTLSFKHRIYQQ